MMALFNPYFLKLIQASSFVFPGLAAVLTIQGTAFSQQTNQGLPSDFEKQVIDVIMRNPEVLIRSVEQYKEELKQAQQERINRVAQSLRMDPARYSKQSPVFGHASAKTQLFVFADFQCPYCAQVRGILQDFVARHPDVLLVYKHYPIVSIHSEAMDASLAAWAAQQQGAFWQYHDIIYSNQSNINEQLLLQAAHDLKLDLKQFNRDRKSSEALAAIKADMVLADSLGISGTPFFVMNGEIFSGAVTPEFLKQQLR
jgi:protein-disulfide isomerase